jgi:hypothetical protein
VRAPQLLAPALALSLLVDALDVGAALLEARARGGADATLLLTRRRILSAHSGVRSGAS